MQAMPPNNPPSEQIAKPEQNILEDRINARDKKLAAPLWEIAKIYKEGSENNGIREKGESDYKKQSLKWMKWGIIVPGVLSSVSLGLTIFTLMILDKQTNMRRSQKATSSKIGWLGKLPSFSNSVRRTKKA
jgi:hypothetical protein